MHIEPLVAFVQKQLSGEVSAALMSEMSALKRAEEPMYASVKTATATSATMDRQRLGDHLVEAGLVNDVQLHYALAEQKNGAVATRRAFSPQWMADSADGGVFL